MAHPHKSFCFRKVLPCRLGMAVSPKNLHLHLSIPNWKCHVTTSQWKMIREKDGRRRLVSQPTETVNQQTATESMYLEAKRGPQPLGNLCLHQRSWRMVKGKAGETGNSSSIGDGVLPDGSRLISVGRDRWGKHCSLLMSPLRWYNLSLPVGLRANLSSVYWLVPSSHRCYKVKPHNDHYHCLRLCMKPTELEGPVLQT